MACVVQRRGTGHKVLGQSGSWGASDAAATARQLCVCVIEGYGAASWARGSCLCEGWDMRISPRNACDWLAGVGGNANPRGYKG